MHEKAEQYAIQEIDALLARIIPEVQAKCPPFILASFPVDKVVEALRISAINILANGWKDGYKYGSVWGEREGGFIQTQGPGSETV